MVAVVVGQGYAATLVTWMAIAALAAASLRFVLLIGELNFAVAAFYGIGAYAASLATTLWGWPFALSLLLAAGVAAVFSVVFGFITLRTKGPYFLLIGFAFTEVMRIVYTRSPLLGGNSGMVGIFPPEALQGWFHVFAVAMAASGVLVLYALERSHLGRVFTAIRDNENVVRSVGIHAHGMKILCFGIACAAAGLAGALHAFANNVISPGDFGFLLSASVLAYLKVGGEDHAVGPVVGAVLMVLLGSLAQSFGGSEHIFHGAGIVVAVLFMPRGLVGWVSMRVRPSQRRHARQHTAGESL
ncbi:branched-chain amino acid ABC transporter permease [Variovorax sp. PBS-H4]|uniref:branched-chain amino acid ABC transporter permease n=1 Tax=Variovorax sp. PBS-H4 TaxID=434008 RepID=UPI001E5F1FB6|nr:branched-chain amino acid ABC transporter permease [Variovorax sp. PBS-H4]